METHTIVGVFENDLQARRAVDRLVEWGFTRDNVQITSNTTMEMKPAIASDTSAPHQSIGAVFRRLFGGKASHEDVDLYAEAVRRGGTVVTVTSGSDDGADSAADILNEHGAVDIEVHARYLRESGWQGSPSAPTTPSATSADSKVTPNGQAESPSRERQRDKGGARIYSRTGRGESE
ncbi:MAG: hypothetical protein ACM3SS_02140 [Rhodospirillaceae bacterium]